MTVFEFSDFKEFLRYRLSQDLYGPSGRKRSTLKRVAQGIGYSSPSLLSMVVNGRRNASDELCEALAQSWRLPLREREYFRLLAKLGRARQENRDPMPILEDMKRVAGKRQIHVYDEAQFAILRDWHMLVIKQLVGSSEFKEDPTWISKKLRKKITPAQAEAALVKMQEIGILERDLETGRLQCRVGGAESTHSVPSAAIRAHHAQMMDRAKEALEDRPIEERLFNSLTFKVSDQRIPELRERLVEFVRSMNAEFSDDSSASVHQLCLQFFEHTATVQATLQQTRPEAQPEKPMGAGAEASDPFEPLEGE